MKILILSFYFEPDLCAGSFRCTALVNALKQIPGVEVEVVTTLPNRYASFSAEAPEYQQTENVEIHRISLPQHESGLADQAQAFISYYHGAKRIVSGRQYDGVYATSSRLFTAFLGAQISRKVNAPLYLDIRDIFVDTINDIMSKKITFLAQPILSAFEKYAFNRAKKINLVSKGFEGYFRQRYPKKNFSWFTNGIDDEFIASSRNVTKDARDFIQILYAGNIGEGQGLHTIVPELAKAMGGKVKFTIIGAGGRLSELKLAVTELSNVEILPPVKREQLIHYYQQADILFMHLNDYQAFEKVLPSKIFEYAAVGKPVLAGVAGYAASFVKEEVSNSAVFYPGNAKQAVDAINQLNLKDCNRIEFVSKFSRQNIMNEMALDIVNVFRRSQI